MALVSMIFFPPVFISLSIENRLGRVSYAIIRLWAIICLLGIGILYSVSGNFNEKRKPKIILSNHTSELDILLMYALHRYPITFVGKYEIGKYPIIGPIYKRICILVDRSDPKSRTAVYEAVKKKLEENLSVVIFPEGGVSDDLSIILSPFKIGAFVMSTSYRTPLSVFVFKGVKEAFPFGLFAGHPAKVKVKFLGEIEAYNTPAEDLQQEVYQFMLKELTN